jgi:hypothetical protein
MLLIVCSREFVSQIPKPKPKPPLHHHPPKTSTKLIHHYLFYTTGFAYTLLFCASHPPSSPTIPNSSERRKKGRERRNSICPGDSLSLRPLRQRKIKKSTNRLLGSTVCALSNKLIRMFYPSPFIFTSRPQLHIDS